MFRFPQEKLKSILETQKLVTAEQFADALADAARMNQSVGDVLISKGYITEDYLYNLAASHFGVERANLNLRGIDRKALSLVDEKFCREKGIIPFSQDADKTINVAMEDPSDLPTIEFLEHKLNARVRPFLASPRDMAKGFSMFGSELTEDFKKIIDQNVRTSLEKKINLANDEDAAAQLPVVDIVNSLLAYGASLNASDIHIEELEDVVMVRFRIDGILYEIIRMPKEIQSAIVARIKLLAALKIDEHQRPQDGRFRFNSTPTAIDVRVSILPTLYGEKIVMRLLPASQRPLSLAEVGMLQDTAQLVTDNIKKTYGMILVTGPTGSGKTTTLYAVLNMLNQPQVNIVTIEDPIEYNIKYINQIQINPVAGITFAAGLRSILRQDPNIIMVGEIRDEETGEIAVNAALTGHLLLSSLHTNDAPTAVPRLMDMKIQPFLIAAVLNLVIAQRLVRKICIDCIESYPVSPELEKDLREQLKIIGVDPQSMPRTLYRGKGCKACNNTGYRGRMGIFEAFEVTENIRKIIISGSFSLDDIVRTARQNGMVTMFEDGLRKAALGMTTIEEVLRVIRE
jgi:type IV pilus assembly protein PilB